MAPRLARRGPRHPDSNIALHAASAQSMAPQDALVRAILEAQKLVENLQRIQLASGPLEPRTVPATRRASRHQSTSSTAQVQDKLHDLAHTSWEVTRQQNSSLDDVIRRLAAEAKPTPPATEPSPELVEPQPVQLPVAPSLTTESAAINKPPRSHSSTSEPVPIPPVAEPPTTLSGSDELLGTPPSIHPDDLPDISPNYHPDDLPKSTPTTLQPAVDLAEKEEPKPSPPTSAPREKSEADAAFDGDGITLLNDATSSAATTSHGSPTLNPEDAFVVAKIHKTLTLLAGIQHEFDNKVLVLYPSAEQWLNFTNILSMARQLGAGNVGAFKVRLSDETLQQLGPRYESDPQPRPKKACNGYRSKRLPNMTFNVTTTNDLRVFRRSDPSPLPLPDAVSHLEHLLRKKQGLKGVFYRTDIPVQTLQDRFEAGLPPRSAIWPLQGDMLRHTKQEIPGIHWPYGYESAASFGALFALHNEDFNLHSVSHLHQGRKIWLMIPPASASELEKKMRETDPTIRECGQCIRHRSLFVPTTVLDEWEIPYTLVDQRAPEIVVTMPQTYHSGFSTGYTLAEASNYADSQWTPVGYSSCPSSCPDYPIDGALMSFLEQGEEQVKWEADPIDDNDQVTSDQEGSKRAAAHLSTKAAVKKKAMPKKSMTAQAPTSRPKSQTPSTSKRRSGQVLIKEAQSTTDEMPTQSTAQDMQQKPRRKRRSPDQSTPAGSSKKQRADQPVDQLDVVERSILMANQHLETVPLRGTPHDALVAAS